MKKLAFYHQYFAVNKAVESIMGAASEGGDRKGGVIWHTQGSGKSLSMVFLAGKLILKLNNPTIVVITDRKILTTSYTIPSSLQSNFLGRPGPSSKQG